MRRDGRAAAILITLISALMAVGMVVLFDQVDHLLVFVLAGILFILVVAPIGFRLARHDLDPFESIIPYGIMNLLYYGLGTIFVLTIDGVAYDQGILPYLDAAAACCTLGYGCALVGYVLAGRVVRPRLGSQGPTPGWMPILALYLVGFSGEVTFAILERGPAKLGHLISGVDSLLSQLSFLSPFALFYVLFMVMSGRAGGAFRTMLFAVMIPTQLLSLYLRIGNKTALFLAVGLPIIANWYARRKIAWKSITVVMLVSIFIIFPLYYTVRNYKSAYYSQGRRIEKTLEEVSRQRVDLFAENALKTVARRLAIVNSTAVVIRECGSRVEYARGSTLWLGVLSAFIPRILWPDKPMITIGIQFSRTFHVTSFGNFSATSPSQAGELWWNFNIVGVIVGMFLIGVWLRVLYLRFGANRGSDPFRLAIYVTLLYMTLMVTDGYLAGLEALIIKQGAILLGLEKLFLLSGSFGRGATPAPAQ